MPWGCCIGLGLLDRLDCVPLIMSSSAMRTPIRHIITTASDKVTNLGVGGRLKDNRYPTAVSCCNYINLLTRLIDASESEDTNYHLAQGTIQEMELLVVLVDMFTIHSGL